MHKPKGNDFISGECTVNMIIQLVMKNYAFQLLV